jgi:alkaline phosphatase/streptomycin-6-phosphatase
VHQVSVRVRGIAAATGIVAAIITLPHLPSTAQNGDRTDELKSAIRGGHAHNIILFLGDGLGDSEITLARNYAAGAAGRLALDTLPFTGAYTTYSVQEANPRLPNYVTDSAAAGTAWATGFKTSNGRISTSADTDRDLKTILEIAHERGLRVGDVTTAELTDATPAVLAAHVVSRTCHGPSDMAACPQDRKSAGGPGSIAEQEIDHHVDVLLGGGYARFDQPTDAGPLVLQHAIAAGYHVVTAEAGLDLAQPGGHVLGLFAPGNMTAEWSGAEALPYPSNVKSPQTCEQDRRPTNEPSLAEMTAKAIQLLDRGSSEPGFFLQVEGASIDKQAHAANPCAQIGETIAFDRAVHVGLDYARAHPDTLLVVTADHGHSTQIVPVPTDTVHSTSLFSVLKTVDGEPLAVAYGTSGYHDGQQHTGTQVRVAAVGPQAANVVGVIDQTELFEIFQRALPPAPSVSAQRASTRPDEIHFVFSSDAHFGITRQKFRGTVNVGALVVNHALVEELNGLSRLTFPRDGGLDAAEAVGPIDFMVEGGDVANRQEITETGPIQPGAVSWTQFVREYIDGVTLRTPAGGRTPIFVVPGNHEASNAVGFSKPMRPLIDKTPMTEIYNRMLMPAVPKTTAAFDYIRDKVLYTRDIGGVHFVFLQIWPDSIERAWLERDLERVSSTTPVVLFAHDQPDVETKHFINPNGAHDINATDRFENLLADRLADGKTIAVESTIEQEALEAFIKRHPNVTAYFHGNSNWNQFYDWTGPRHSIALHTFRVDSPMKGAISSADETKLSFQVITIETASRTMTVRECLWNADPAHPILTWGASTTVALTPRPEGGLGVAAIRQTTVTPGQ